ncbi:hypothetical protein BGP77_02675 [Saccharospirillum sp. MSK14-1]|uniref:Mpo1 family 2-hydroxy fatty acid dioxygenase n=1 Tax=Saccharospirillum sp. MSK14-1 TaxID=1897632 RepID=UPI000D331B35|nr:Mpo1-like protein [Saccharospirillum sp. MSK14-1]PTY36234.1 hypothetical protein BGP77_02675 [Saccharospirillum sp. MSK14-1]
MLNKSVDQWLSEYGESHQNRINKRIHWICVPVILWCILALLWQVRLADHPWLNGASVFILFGVLFYARLSWTLTLGMALVAAVSVGLILAYQSAGFALPLWAFALGLFVLAWIGQFVGHKIEGKKPSFFQDIQFLMVGPAWLLSFIYRRLGIPVHG